jgi:hypothetical protein
VHVRLTRIYFNVVWRSKQAKRTSDALKKPSATKAKEPFWRRMLQKEAFIGDLKINGAIESILPRSDFCYGYIKTGRKTTKAGVDFRYIIFPRKFCSPLNCRVARWFIFKPKIQIWVYYRGTSNVKCCVWCTYVVCGHLVYFSRFIMFSPRKVWQPLQNWRHFS